jgi:hypothetical protein
MYRAHRRFIGLLGVRYEVRIKLLTCIIAHRRFIGLFGVVYD